jgi:hypothetical protein
VVAIAANLDAVLCGLADKMLAVVEIRMIRSTTAHDPLTEALGSNQAGWHVGVERRRSPRAALHWTLYLRCSGVGHPVRTEARNISRDGFYCLLTHPIRAGERVECDIVVPTHSSLDPEDVVYLRCSAQAVRVEKIRAGAEFGLACRLDYYSVIHGPRQDFAIQSVGEAS